MLDKKLIFSTLPHLKNSKGYLSIDSAGGSGFFILEEIIRSVT
jgi:hypothetical protein